MYVYKLICMYNTSLSLYIYIYMNNKQYTYIYVHIMIYTYIYIYIYILSEAVLTTVGVHVGPQTCKNSRCSQWS